MDGSVGWNQHNSHSVSLDAGNFGEEKGKLHTTTHHEMQICCSADFPKLKISIWIYFHTISDRVGRTSVMWFQRLIQDAWMILK